MASKLTMKDGTEPDITPLDVFLWADLKSAVHQGENISA